MDASQRWETEALRSGSHSRKASPRPSEAQQAPKAESHDPDANWVTLKEAEAATGIPLNTLRKWSRKSAIPSYLDSDGELPLRMVDLDAVIAHAHDLGRATAPVPDPEPATEPATEADAEVPAPPEGTLIVPIDAWDKMLNQLGNLHEAGQQLAEARERAAKAETEATFLRERLAELRAQTSDAVGVPLSRGTAEGRSSDAGGSTAQDTSGNKSTTSYWRYLTFGWRDRKRRSSNKE